MSPHILVPEGPSALTLSSYSPWRLSEIMSTSHSYFHTSSSTKNGSLGPFNVWDSELFWLNKTTGAEEHPQQSYPTLTCNPGHPVGGPLPCSGVTSVSRLFHLSLSITRCSVTSALRPPPHSPSAPSLQLKISLVLPSTCGYSCTSQECLPLAST